MKLIRVFVVSLAGLNNLKFFCEDILAINETYI